MIRFSFQECSGDVPQGFQRSLVSRYCNVGIIHIYLAKIFSASLSESGRWRSADQEKVGFPYFSRTSEVLCWLVGSGEAGIQTVSIHRGPFDRKSEPTRFRT